MNPIRVTRLQRDGLCFQRSEGVGEKRGGGRRVSTHKRKSKNDGGKELF